MLHQFIFWICQKKAVPLQRISKHKLRMKTFIHCIILAVVLCLAVACDPGPVAPGPGTDSFPNEFAVADIPSEQMPSILADTVTPPSNPLAPADLNSYPTFVGVLTLLPCNFNNMNGKYVCGMQLVAPIQYINADNESFTYMSVYLLDCDTKMPVRFNHTMLTSCVVGDTILVTGTPKEISNGGALGLTMYYVQPQL